MYNLDINFLKDRYLQETAKAPKKLRVTPSLEEQQLLLLGAGVMVFLLAIAGGGAWLLNWQVAQTEENLKSLNQELSLLNLKNQSLKEIETEIGEIDQETAGLVSVFNQIKSWTAILEDIQSRTPQGVQIASIQEGGAAGDKKAPSQKKEETATVPTTPTVQLSIKGYAPNYADANDFLLSLQGSSFLTAEKTKLESAKLVDLPIKWSGQEQLKGENLEVVFPQVVEYTITTELNQVPASQLRQELARKGAVGLVTRLNTLKEAGVKQP